MVMTESAPLVILECPGATRGFSYVVGVAVIVFIEELVVHFWSEATTWACTRSHLDRSHSPCVLNCLPLQRSQSNRFH